MMTAPGVAPANTLLRERQSFASVTSPNVSPPGCRGENTPERAIGISTALLSVRVAIEGLTACYGASQIGTCVARATRVEEDGFAGGPFVGCTGGPLP